MRLRGKSSKTERIIAALAGAFFLEIAATMPTLASGEVLVFQQCTFESNRYLVCRVPPPEVETALNSADRIHAGEAFGKFLVAWIESRRCTGAVDQSAFIVNGVFFSVDSRAFEPINCAATSAKLQFSEEKAVAFGSMQFWFDQVR